MAKGMLIPDREAQFALLTVAYWWHAGSHAMAPEWVKKHPMWPANNDRFHLATAGTACPGRERLWDALFTEFFGQERPK